VRIKDLKVFLSLLVLLNSAWALANTSGETCVTGDKNHICLGIKYAVYQNGNNGAILSEQEAIENVKGINDLWKQCNVGFQIDQFSQVEPERNSLNYEPGNLEELPQIRSQLGGEDTLLVVTTGQWNRRGTLGNTGANAWTSLPGDFPFGVVLEQSVATFSNIIAHELGHYLNLLHVGDSGNLMNPIIYPDSNRIASDQCELSRTTALSSWIRMVR
jgi:hypothetical protein